MKRYITIFLLVLIFISSLLMQSCCMVSTDVLFESKRKRSYYSDITCYIEASGRIESYHYNQERDTYYFILQPDWSPQEKSVDPHFKVVGNGVDILQENNIEKKLEPGSFIEFIYAPKYFGDGYIRPIVSLRVDGATMLEFDDGYYGLLETL